MGKMRISSILSWFGSVLFSAGLGIVINQLADGKVVSGGVFWVAYVGILLMLGGYAWSLWDNYKNRENRGPSSKEIKDLCIAVNMLIQEIRQDRLERKQLESKNNHSN